MLHDTAVKIKYSCVKYNIILTVQATINKYDSKNKHNSLTYLISKRSFGIKITLKMEG
jgi:hypothetical protein